MAITRKEAILSAIANGESSSINPVTREEQLLADIANGKASKITPVTRQEMFLSAISNVQKPTVPPITREEQYLSYIGGGTSNYPEKPITNTEFWLEKIANKSGGGSGGGSTDQTALAGAYTADGTFSNREYTWDEMVERGSANGSYSSPCYLGGGDYEPYILAEYPYYDIVVPDTMPYVGMFYCNNIVLPSTTTKVDGSDGSSLGKVYIKANDPPQLTEWAFDEIIYQDVTNFAIIVPIGSGSKFKSATNWSKYADYITEGAMPI